MQGGESGPNILAQKCFWNLISEITGYFKVLLPCNKYREPFFLLKNKDSLKRNNE